MAWRMLDLFSGIGGFSLAAQWCWGDELEIVAFCEIDKFCQEVLRKHWPDVPIIEDVKELDGKQWTETIDILTGGFPCQPFSFAGRRKGKNDDRWLWPQMLRIIMETEPNWIIGENVTGIDSMELDSIISDLETCRYETGTFEIPACAVDSPQWRNRTWFVANLANRRLSERRPKRESRKNCERNKSPNDVKKNPGSAWPEIAARICRMDKRISKRMDRIRVLGNAIMPQIAFQIFKAIKEIDDG